MKVLTIIKLAQWYSSASQFKKCIVTIGPIVAYNFLFFFPPTKSNIDINLGENIAETLTATAYIAPSVNNKLFETQNVEKRIIESRVIPRNNLSSNNFLDGSFDPWVNEYIRFHKSAIKNGRLRPGFRFVVFKCSAKERCGGAGDRVLSMVKAFYFAMITNRVLFIDSQFPDELKNYMNPNFVKWDAEYPLTELFFDDMNKTIGINRREGVIGYYLDRCNGLERSSLKDLLNYHYKHVHLRKIKKPSIPRAYHQAFWALFKFDDSVLLRAEKMKVDAGLSLLPHNDGATIRDGNKKKTAPYVGLHHRHGDGSIPGILSGLKGGSERGTDKTSILKCYHNFRRRFKYQAAYLASDSLDIKKEMKEQDKTIHYPPEVNIFHVDLSTRKKVGDPSMNSSDIHQGVLDTWGEIAVLVDSECLVMSRSFFSFLAYYIRGESKCSVFVENCNDKTVNQKINKYNVDPLAAIHMKN